MANLPPPPEVVNRGRKALRRQRAAEILADLAGRFACFRKPHRPLKLGTRGDLIAAGLSHEDVREVLGRFCHRLEYLRACTEGADRIDLDGNVVGTVSASEAENARLRLEARRKPPKPTPAKKPTVPAPANEAVVVDDGVVPRRQPTRPVITLSHEWKAQRP